MCVCFILWEGFKAGKRRGVLKTLSIFYESVILIFYNRIYQFHPVSSSLLKCKEKWYILVSSSFFQSFKTLFYLFSMETVLFLIKGKEKQNTLVSSSFFRKKLEETLFKWTFFSRFFPAEKNTSEETCQHCFEAVLGNTGQY